MNSLPTSTNAARIATVSAVSSDTSAVTLLAENAARVGFIVHNDSSAVLYVKFGASASSTDYTIKLAAAGTYECPSYPVYVGLVTGIWAAANGHARVTELQESL